jgi:acyl-coenzyme A thioesterase PaaI-like protein
MNLQETDEELEARTRLASAVQALGHALVSHRIGPDLAHELADVLDGLTMRVEQCEGRDRTEEVNGVNGLAGLLSGRNGRPAIAEGAELDLFRDSIVSGTTNPLGIGLKVRRVGDTVEAITTLRPAFEGAPGRAHGGVVAAILDETMGFVLPLIGELAYTANLNIDYLAPAPLGESITFTARLRDRADRKLWIEATGASASGPFVRAEALFLTVDFSRFAPT